MPKRRDTRLRRWTIWLKIKAIIQMRADTGSALLFFRFEGSKDVTRTTGETKTTFSPVVFFTKNKAIY